MTFGTNVLLGLLQLMLIGKSETQKNNIAPLQDFISYSFLLIRLEEDNINMHDKMTLELWAPSLKKYKR